MSIKSFGRCSFLKDGEGFMHYLAEVEGKKGLCALYHQDIELEAMPNQVIDTRLQIDYISSRYSKRMRLTRVQILLLVCIVLLVFTNPGLGQFEAFFKTEPLSQYLNEQNRMNIALFDVYAETGRLYDFFIASIYTAELSWARIHID